MGTGQRRRVVIMGAAGRDFHNFNVAFRDAPHSEVVAFTATQIPGIEGRHYPPELAGPLYPDGIPILAESELAQLCARERIDEAIFAYSDVSHAEVMHKASVALATGADFRLMGPNATMLKSVKPVISVCAVRTGVGKSQVSRWISARLRSAGLRVAMIRHPMPYGDLAAQAVQRFSSIADLASEHCTLEEREEYEPHIASGSVVFAGVDYAAILRRAEAEADVVLWDGGNNDFPFIRPDLAIALVDGLRPDQADTHHPGETVLRMADIVVIAKANSATPQAISQLKASAGRLCPRARVLRGASVVTLDEAAVRGRRVVVVEDGPTLTHGGMATGAGYAGAVAAGADIIDPRAFAKGEMAQAFAKYSHLGPVLPALGYSPQQLADLAETIVASGCEAVVAGTPVDLAAVLDTPAPIVRARYDYQEMDEPGLGSIIDAFIATGR